MIRAFLYLQLASVANAVTQRIRRLRQPKYLVGALVGAAYFYWFFFRNFSRQHGLPDRSPFPAGAAPWIEPFAAALLFVFVLVAWIFGRDRAALQFSEAEVAFLFPAPVSRRTLIHFKLLRSQLGILFTTLVFALLSNRFSSFGGSAGTHAAGWWIVLSTLNLHQLGASFTRDRLWNLGIDPVRRRALIVAALVVLGAVTWWWVRREVTAAPAGASLGDWVDYAQRALTTGPLAWALAPCRLVVRPFFANGVGAFLLAAGPALLVLAAHYAWVVRSDVAFEEASLALAQKRRELVSTLRQGGRRSAKASRPPFTLAAAGPAPIAFLWKNLLAAGSLYRIRNGLAAAAALTALCGWLKTDPAFQPLLGFIGSASVGLLAWATLLGPQMFRYDLRHDLANADILKAFPLRGWQIVLGELLAPVAILTSLQWLLVLTAALALSGPGRGVSHAPAWFAALAAGAALLAPCLAAPMLLLPNAAALLFPAWAQPGQRQGGGIELMGQRIVLLAGQMLVLAVAAVPSAIVGTFIFVFGRMLLGDPAAMVLAAVCAAGPLLFETGLAIWWLGERFETFDLSSELSL